MAGILKKVMSSSAAEKNVSDDVFWNVKGIVELDCVF
jgi:hypothetical protein